MDDGHLEIRLPGRSDNSRLDAGGGFGDTLVLRHKEVHHFFFVPFREQPIYSTRAHVFQIDPNTKKNWLPTSKHAVTVSYFYDSTRNVYRIISLDGTKVRCWFRLSLVNRFDLSFSTADFVLICFYFKMHRKV